MFLWEAHYLDNLFVEGKRLVANIHVESIEVVHLSCDEHRTSSKSLLVLTISTGLVHFFVTSTGFVASPIFCTKYYRIFPILLRKAQ